MDNNNNNRITICRSDNMTLTGDDKATKIAKATGSYSIKPSSVGFVLSVLALVVCLVVVPQVKCDQMGSLNGKYRQHELIS